MQESDYFRALGVTPRNAAPEENRPPEQQEVVEPAEEIGNETKIENDKEKAVVEPSIEPEEEITGQPVETGKPPMSKEERSRQARLRRQRELEAAITKARQEEQARHKEEMVGLIKRMNIRDAANDNKPIETIEEFQAWEQRQSDAKLERELKNGKLTRDTLERMIEQSPSVKAAREAEAKRQKQSADEQAQNIIAAELAEIEKLDPSVKSLEDICNAPTGKKFRELVERYNMSFVEAFKLANFERLQSVRQAAATQAAINNQASKNHLSSVTSPASNAVNVPSSVYQNYKRLCPWMSEEEIRKDYAKRTKGAQKG